MTRRSVTAALVLALLALFAAGTSDTQNSSQIRNSGGVRDIASGTVTLGTSAIASGACATTVTVAASGVQTTDNMLADFNSDPTSTVGYEPGAMLTIVKFPSANGVNFRACNNTGVSISPTAITLNWRVLR
jgi:hypothetical protein